MCFSREGHVHVFSLSVWEDLYWTIEQDEKGLYHYVYRVKELKGKWDCELGVNPPTIPDVPVTTPLDKDTRT